jgi:hypothetical protein
MTVDRPPGITVVMLVYNEMASIEEVPLRVQAVDPDKEIVLKGIPRDGSGSRTHFQSQGN